MAVGLKPNIKGTLFPKNNRNYLTHKLMATWGVVLTALISTSWDLQVQEAVMFFLWDLVIIIKSRVICPRPVYQKSLDVLWVIRKRVWSFCRTPVKVSYIAKKTLRFKIYTIIYIFNEMTKKNVLTSVYKPSFRQINN